MRGLHDPCAGEALSFSNFASRHFFGNLGPTMLAFLATCQRSQIEPLVSFDKIDIDAAGAATEGNTQIKTGLRIPGSCIAHPALDQKTGTLNTICHCYPPERQTWPFRWAENFHAAFDKWLMVQIVYIIASTSLAALKG